MTDPAGPPSSPSPGPRTTPTDAPWSGGAQPTGPLPGPAPATGSGSGSRTVAHVVGAVAGLVVTPLALVLLGSSGQTRYVDTMQQMGTGRPLAILGVLLGVLLVAAVAVSAAWSWVGPVVGGTLYGVLPGLAWLVAPMPLARATFSVADGRTAQWVSTLGPLGLLLAIGVLLVAAGVVGALARRRAQPRR